MLTLTFQTDGSFSGTKTNWDGTISSESGTCSIDENGIVTCSYTGDGSSSSVMSAGKDVMIANGQDPNELEFGIGVKKGSSYSMSDLAGTSYLRTIQTQKNGGVDNFGYNIGTSITQSDGSHSGSGTDNFR